MTPAPPAVGVLGLSGLRVTRIGLGLAAAGRPGYINVGHRGDLVHGTGVEAMETAAHALLDAAFAGGIRYVEWPGHTAGRSSSWPRGSSGGRFRRVR